MVVRGPEGKDSLPDRGGIMGLEKSHQVIKQTECTPGRNRGQYVCKCVHIRGCVCASRRDF